MSSNKAPSAGTKVTPSSAPTHREGAGAVAPDSLAAESATFTSTNRNAAPGSGPTQTSGKVSAPGEGSRSAGSSGGLESQKSYGGPAPTYVNRQYMRDPGPPKGRNLHEVESFEGEVKDGLEEALRAEPGSEMDPGRAGEAIQFGLEGEGKVLKKPSGVPAEKGGCMYRPLDSDASA